MKELLPGRSTTSSARSRRPASTRRRSSRRASRLVAPRARAPRSQREGLEEIETDGAVRPARPRGAALAAVRGGGGRRHRGAPEGLPARRPRRCGRRAWSSSQGAPEAEWRATTCTRPSASEERLRRTRSRRRTASSRASTTRTATRATRPPRSGSRRSRPPTTCSPTPRSASSTTARLASSLGGGGAGPGGVPVDSGTSAISATSATSSAASSAAAAARASSRGRPGRDVEVEVSLSFEDSLRGVETRIPVEVETACCECGGTGAKPGTAPIICPECHGRGVVAESQGLFALSQPCPRCRGNGTVIEEPCRHVPRLRPRAAHEALHGQDPGRRQGRHADPAQGQGRGRRAAAGRPAISTSSRGSTPSPLYERRGADLASTCR